MWIFTVRVEIVHFNRQVKNNAITETENIIIRKEINRVIVRLNL